MNFWHILWPFVAFPLFGFLFLAIRAALKSWRVQERSVKRYGCVQ